MLLQNDIHQHRMILKVLFYNSNNIIETAFRFPG